MRSIRFRSPYLCGSVAVAAVALLSAMSFPSSTPSNKTAEAPRAAQAAQKWEYKFGTLQKSEFLSGTKWDEVKFLGLESIFNKRGKDGWEFAGIICADGPTGSIYLWKRPID